MLDRSLQVIWHERGAVQPHLMQRQKTKFGRSLKKNRTFEALDPAADEALFSVTGAFDETTPAIHHLFAFSPP